MAEERINVLIIGAGKGGTSLLEAFKYDKVIDIKAIVDCDPDAPGIKLAKKYNIRTGCGWEDFLEKEKIDEIFDVTGVPAIYEEILRKKPRHVGLVGGPSSKMIWSLIEEHKNIEKELEEARKRAEKYLDIAGNIIVALDKNGAIIVLNKKGHDVFGYAEGELIGENWFEVCLPGEIIEEIKEVHLKNIEGGMVGLTHYENEIRTKTGEKRMISWYNTVIRDEKGKVTGTLSSGEDITERKIVETELKDRVKELEVFYKAAVGREHRIIELKEQVQDLKEELEQKKKK